MLNEAKEQVYIFTPDDSIFIYNLDTEMSEYYHFCEKEIKYGFLPLISMLSHVAMGNIQRLGDL